MRSGATQQSKKGVRKLIEPVSLDSNEPSSKARKSRPLGVGVARVLCLPVLHSLPYPRDLGIGSLGKSSVLGLFHIVRGHLKTCPLSLRSEVVPAWLLLAFYSDLLLTIFNTNPLSILVAPLSKGYRKTMIRPFESR